jgi:protein involved in polysaccharide export with SLBB domain
MFVSQPRFLTFLLLLLGSFSASVAEENPESAVKNNDPDYMTLLDDDWELKAGDRVVYEVLEEREDEPLLLVINGNGELLVPLIGRVEAQGKTSKTLAFEIKEELEKEFFHRATVVIRQREEDRNRGRVSVLGEVRRQGEQIIPVDSPLTLSQAIMQSGGFSAEADRTKVSVVGQGQQQARLEIDLGAMLESGDLSQDPILRAGDAVIVPRADQSQNQVYVLGAVNAPGLYSIRGNNFTLSQVILMAEGFTRFARKNKVRLISRDSNGEKTEREIDVGEILEGGDREGDPVIQPGDMVIVDEKMISFTG